MSNAASSSRRLTAQFEGHVQGVGFRYTTVSIARRYPVQGYVQNLVNGDVQMVAEGREADILAFLAALRASHIFQHVVQERLHWSNASGTLTDFEVRYG